MKRHKEYLIKLDNMGRSIVAVLLHKQSYLKNGLGPLD